MFNSQQCRCSVNWEREDGPETCRFFIHDVTVWSKCGHLVDVQAFLREPCLHDRFQPEINEEQGDAQEIAAQEVRGKVYAQVEP